MLTKVVNNEKEAVSKSVTERWLCPPLQKKKLTKVVLWSWWQWSRIGTRQWAADSVPKQRWQCLSKKERESWKADWVTKSQNLQQKLSMSTERKLIQGINVGHHSNDGLLHLKKKIDPLLGPTNKHQFWVLRIFQMRLHISLRDCVRPSVRPSHYISFETNGRRCLLHLTSRKENKQGAKAEKIKE